MDNYKKNFIYGDQLGRITGEGRFNNINSVVVNSHRIFYKDKEDKQDLKTLYEEKNKYNFNKNSNFNYNLPRDNNIKIVTNDYYDKEKLKDIGQTQFNYSANNLLKNNKPSYFNNIGYFLPQSFDSMQNKNLMNSNYDLRKSINNTKSESIEKIFYNYNIKNNRNNFNDSTFNSSNTMPKYYTLDNGFTSGYNSYNPMSKSYSVDQKNMYKSITSKPELLEKNALTTNNINNDILTTNYKKNTFLNTSQYFTPNTNRDFHSIYSNNTTTNINKNNNNTNYNTNSKMMLTLSPNIILNTIQEEQFKKEMETFYQTNKCTTLNENEYTIKQCSSIKEFSVKKYHNEPYNLALTCQIVAIDRFDTNLNDSFFGIFDGINGDEVSLYLKQNLPNLFQRMIHFNPKRNLPYHPPGTKIDKKIKGCSTSIETIFLNLFLKLDEDIKIMKCMDIGATACVIYLTIEENELTGRKQKNKVLYCAFLGDVQCMIASKTRAKKLTKKHSLKDVNEKKRIENIGGAIFDDKIYGQEELTRAFGLYNLKQYGITAIPETVKITISPLDLFIVIGTKGIFDVLSDGDLLNICLNNESTEIVAKNIVQNAVNRFTRDNLGLVVIKI